MSGTSINLDKEINIQVRSPSLDETLVIKIKLNETVLSLKKSIQLVHPHHPITGNQRIIFSGKLLQDEETIHSVVKSADCEIVPTFHLVVKPSLQSFRPQQQPSVPQIQQQQPNSNTHIRESPLPSENDNNTFPSVQNSNMNVPAYPSVLPGGYQVVAINGQYYLAPVLVPSQPVPFFQPNTPLIYQHEQQYQPQQQPQPFVNANNAQPFVNAPRNNAPAPVLVRPAHAQRAASIWLALKLVIVLFMLCQGASIERIFIFHTIAFIFFLYQTGRLRFVLRRVRVEDINNRFGFAGQRVPNPPPPTPAQQNENQAEGASTGVNNNADNLTRRGQNNGEGSSTTPDRPRTPPTFLDTFKRGAYTFFASLWPQYNQDPRIAQAFENNNDQREGGLEEF